MLFIHKILLYVKTIEIALYRFCYICLISLGVTLVPILTFHCFAKDENKKNNEKIKNNRWYASIDTFEKQIKWLVEHKYTFIDIDMFENWLFNGKKLPKKSVLLTFDDGVKSQLDLVVPILKKYNAKGSCFVIGKRWLHKQEKMPINSKEDDYDFFDKEYYDKSIDNQKYMKVQSHTYNLHYKQNKIPAVFFAKQENVNSDSKKMMEKGFKCVALPYGAYAQNTISVISKYYKFAFAFDGQGFPYVTEKSNIFKLNRIAVDGNSTIDILKKYLY